MGMSVTERNAVETPNRSRKLPVRRPRAAPPDEAHWLALFLKPARCHPLWSAAAQLHWDAGALTAPPLTQLAYTLYFALYDRARQFDAPTLLFGSAPELHRLVAAGQPGAADVAAMADQLRRLASGHIVLRAPHSPVKHIHVLNAVAVFPKPDVLATGFKIDLGVEYMACVRDLVA